MTEIDSFELDSLLEALENGNVYFEGKQLNVSRQSETKLEEIKSYFEESLKGECADRSIYEEMLSMVTKEKNTRVNSKKRKLPSNANDLYAKALSSKTGDVILCPCCKSKIIKSSDKKIFCNNRKISGSDNCKDNFWNNIRRRRNNATIQNTSENVRDY